MLLRKRRFISPAIYGAVVGGGGSPVLTFVSSSAGGSHTGAVETYATQNIGTASGFTTRRIICVTTTNNVNGSNISSATIGGISATVHVVQSLGAGAPFVGIFSAAVPTGTTATIAVTYNASIFNDQGLAVYSVDDALLLSTTPSTGSGTASAVTTVSTTSFTQTIGGFTIAAGALSAAPTGHAISGYTNNFLGGTSTQVVASLTSIGSTGSITATDNWTNSANAVIAAASWR